MGIINEGINGGFNGKVGNVVGYNRMGKWVMRALPKVSTKNKLGTTAQKASRTSFAMMQHFLSPILDYIRIGFNMEGRKRQMTAHNAAKSYNMLNAITPEGKIDYTKVLISYGSLPGALNPRIEKDDVGLHFSWDNNSDEKGAKADDQVTLVAFDVTDEKARAYGITSGARRKIGTQTIELSPLKTGTVLHAWMAFISDDRNQVSMSSYMGEIVY